MRQIWTGSLQWYVGLLCAVLGALMLVAPHHFAVRGSVWLEPHIVEWGFLFLLAAAGLVVTAAQSVPRWVHVGVHLLAGALLLVIAGGFGVSGALSGLTRYAVLGIGTAAAAFLPRYDHAGERPVDLFAVLMGAATAVTGIVMFVHPEEFRFPTYVLVLPYLPWYGAAFLVTGLALVDVHRRRRVPSAVFVGGHLLVAAVFFVMLGRASLPHGAWTSIVYYGGFGVALALLPWLGPRMRRADLASLRIRLAVTLAAAVAVPIILTVTAATTEEQRLMLKNELAVQRAHAAGLATNIGDYLRLQRAAAVALAAHPGLLAMKPAEQARLLESYASGYIESDAIVFATYDDLGRPLARSDRMGLVPGDRIPGFETVRNTYIRLGGWGLPAWEETRLARSPTGRPELNIFVPIRGSDTPFAGAVIVTLPTARITDLLSRTLLDPNGRAYLVTNAGALVTFAAGSSAAPPPSDVSTLPPVAAMLRDTLSLSGSLMYSTASGDWLAGHAQVPALEWGVVTEEPAAAVLASVKAERNLAFWLLLVAIVVAGIFGVAGGGIMARPLSSLARAMGQYTATGGDTPLPRSTTSEVARLATSFREMRDRITARTEERARAEEALQRESTLVRLLQDVAIAANKVGTAEEACRVVVEQVCRVTRWSVGHVWVAGSGEGGGRVWRTNVWYLDDPKRRHEFQDATDTARFAARDGLPGRVADAGHPVWIRDVTAEPNFPRAAAAAASGLRAAFAIPIEAGGELAGVMEFFMDEAIDTDTMFMETIALAGTQVGRVFERERRNREAALLNEMAELLQASLTIDEAYAVITQFGAKFFPAATGELFVMSPSKDILEPTCAWGAAGRAGGFAPDECWALRRGQLHRSDGTGGVMCPHLGDAPGSSLCVAMQAQNENLGVLQLQWDASPTRGDRPAGEGAIPAQAWEARERLAMAMARQIGPAIASLRLRETLRVQSVRDPLTGLFNRRYMEESLEREIHRAARRSSNMAVMMLDLDHFKLFNDTHGHEAGDAMLSTFGAFLVSHIRKEDIACRYGGEEFILILTDVTYPGALDRAEHLREAATNLHVLHRGETLGRLTVSIGVAVFPTHGTTGKLLVRAADAALYRAKQNGRARVEVAV